MFDTHFNIFSRSQSTPLVSMVRVLLVVTCSAFVVVMVGRREDDVWKHFHRTQYGKGFKANYKFSFIRNIIDLPLLIAE